MTEDHGAQLPLSGARGPLPARSAAEAHLYLILHPCECGAPRPHGSQELREGGDGGLVTVHAGTCPGCGRRWSVVFTLPASAPLPGCIGGTESSAIIDPGEWFWLSEQDAGVPAGGGPLSPDDRARLGRAADETDEVAKFIPPGHDRVPDGAFTSSLGRAMHAAFPGRFLKADLDSRAQLYRAGARPGYVRHPMGQAS
jgi:hypothetical protein